MRSKFLYLSYQHLCRIRQPLTYFLFVISVSGSIIPIIYYSAIRE